MRRFTWSGALVLVCCLLAASTTADEQLRKELRAAWSKSVPAGQQVPVKFSISSNLAEQNGSADGTGVMIDMRRGHYQFKGNSKKYDVFESSAALIFKEGKKDSAEFVRAGVEHRRKDAALQSFASPREMAELTLNAHFKKIRRGPTQFVAGSRCRLYYMTLDERGAQPMLNRFGLKRERVAGKKQNMERFTITFFVDREAKCLRRIELTLSVEVDKEKPKEEEDKFSWEQYESGDSAARVGQKEGEGPAGPVKLVARKTVIKSYSATVTFQKAEPLQPLPLPADAKGKLHWR